MTAQSDDNEQGTDDETDAQAAAGSGDLFGLLQRWFSRYRPEKRYMRGSDG